MVVQKKDTNSTKNGSKHFHSGRRESLIDILLDGFSILIIGVLAIALIALIFWALFVW